MTGLSAFGWFLLGALAVFAVMGAALFILTHDLDCGCSRCRGTEDP